MSAEILNAALEYASAGFAVIPVKRSDKHPYTQNGLKDATVNESTIRQWWTWWPEANVAIACGRPSGNVFALDIDIKPEEGKHGDESVQKWEAKHGDFPETVRQITGSGGMHCFYRLAGIEKYKNTIEALPGVDIRGDGAYVVVSPSVYEDGRTYRWDRDVSILDTDEIAEANESVIALLALNPRNEERTSGSAAHERLDLSNVQEGRRNDSIFRYAALQRGANVPFDVALTGALELNANFDDPLSESEVKKSVVSAFKYEPNEATIYGPLPEPEPEADELDIKTLDEFEEQEVEWLIPGYLPKNQITLVCGTGGTGKTSIWISILASLSSGDKTIFSGASIPPKHEGKRVMFFSSEDTVENVIKKKLRLQKANMRNITTVSINDPRFDKVKFGSKYLEQLIRKYRPELCVFDPLQAFIDGRIKMSDRNAMRQTMRCLIEWGDKYGTTFLVVMHTNKLQNAWGRNRMADSADLWDIARCVWMVGDTDQEGIHYLSHEKNNYGPTSQTVLFTNTGGLPAWYMFSGLKDRDFVTAAAKERNSKKGNTDIEDAVEFIMSELTDHPEGMYTKDLQTLMEDTGFKTWAVKRAKARLKESKRIKYFKDVYSDGWKVKKI